MAIPPADPPSGPPSGPPSDAGDASARRWIERVTACTVLGDPEEVQELWSGYGRIERFRLRGAGDAPASVILKAVRPPRGSVDHPRGFGTDRSHQRKLKSYEVEHTFYSSYRERLTTPEGEVARVPHLLGHAALADGSLLLLEDLDAAGFDGRRQGLAAPELTSCLHWLAEFHGRLMGAAPTGLWQRGTYWHLATRPDELAAMERGPLQGAAHAIDQRLEGAQHRTILHGDAKVANFCFGPGDQAANVAAVDFQYAGGGVGVQDVAYLLGSCLEDSQLEEQAAAHLDAYFEELRRQVQRFHPSMDPDAIESEWRALWATCWADFHRFLVGWAPGHWKLSRFSEAMLQETLRSLPHA